MFQAVGSNKSNQVFQFVPGLAALHRMPFSLRILFRACGLHRTPLSGRR